jgi:hypothetical protein
MEVDYNRFVHICKKAVEDKGVFDGLKKNPSFFYMLEHVNEKQGNKYLEEIEKHTPSLMDLMDRFKTNDSIGNPTTFNFANIGAISPTTLRYVKVLSDLIMIFGGFNDLDIVEIGVGYGGQCKIIHDYCTPKSYTMIDLPEVLALAKKCNEHHNIQNVIYKTANELDNITCDLLISNYAFTEVGRKYQQLYSEKVIKNARMGYMTCNYFGFTKQRDVFTKEEAFSKEEITALKNNYQILQEIPLTSPGNFIYIWK